MSLTEQQSAFWMYRCRLLIASICLPALMEAIYPNISRTIVKSFISASGQPPTIHPSAHVALSKPDGPDAGFSIEQQRAIGRYIQDLNIRVHAAGALDRLTTWLVPSDQRLQGSKEDNSFEQATAEHRRTLERASAAQPDISTTHQASSLFYKSILLPDKSWSYPLFRYKDCPPDLYEQQINRPSPESRPQSIGKRKKAWNYDFSPWGEPGMFGSVSEYPPGYNPTQGYRLGAWCRYKGYVVEYKDEKEKEEEPRKADKKVRTPVVELSKL